MSFLYPRKVSIYRPSNQTVAGENPYSGLANDQLTILFSSLQCAVQMRKATGTPLLGLPGGQSAKPIYVVLILGLKIGDIKDRDVVVDDEGYRYQVTANYWTPLSYQITCERLES